MLSFLRDKVSQRKIRLFVCACCRRIWHLLPDERSRRTVEIVERFAEGLANKEALEAARVAANAAADAAVQVVCAADAVYSEDRSTASAYSIAEAIQSAAYAPCMVAEDVVQAANSVLSTTCAVGCNAEAAAYATGGDDSAARTAEQFARAAEGSAQADLLRHFVGNPFQASCLDPNWLAWNGNTITELARAIHEELRFDDLPILADALEEAGCTDTAILNHCREPGPHMRGCWVLDLLLGKS
jgi:hypothetical protein